MKLVVDRHSRPTMPKRAKPISSWIDDVEAGQDHGAAGHGQAGSDVVPTGPKADDRSSAGPTMPQLAQSQLFPVL
jgi:antitoxin (DNA-binding transcriptional repressor) of toxin-antitoxin stability system